MASQQGSQVIAASHSEVVLNEAANRDVVIAFVGQPHRMDDRGQQLLQARTDIGFDRLDRPLQSGTPLTELMWQRREIENYLCEEDVLVAYARHDQPDDLFGRAEALRREQVWRVPGRCLPQPKRERQSGGLLGFRSPSGR